MQKSSAASHLLNPFSALTAEKPTSKLSFGLYTGELPVDHGCYTKNVFGGGKEGEGGADPDGKGNNGTAGGQNKVGAMVECPI